MALLPLAAAATVFFPITRSYFHTDDFLCLQAIVNDSLPHFVLRPLGGHVLIARNLLFVLFYRLFGTHAAAWFGVVLLTHLLNVALLYVLVRRLTGSSRIACFAAILWGASPLQEGALGWYSVYGQVVLGTVLLVVLLGMAGCWRSDARLGWRQTLGWCVLIVVGATLFGIGVGVALAFPLAILVLFPARQASPGIRVAVIATAVLVAIGYREIHLLFATEFGDRTDVDYAMVFALASYWQNSVVMVVHLVAAGTAALLWGFGSGLAPYPGATATVTAVAFVCATGVVFVTSGGRERRLLLASLVLVVGVYAIIAAGRSTLYAGGIGTATGAALARYHYVATIPLTVIAGLVLARSGTLLRLPSTLRAALLPAWLLVIAVLYVRSGWHIDLHEMDRRLTGETVSEIARAIRETPDADVVHIPNRRFQPAWFPDVFAGTAAVYTIFFPASFDARVRFVEPDAAARQRVPPGSRLALVLAPPPPSPGP